MSKKLILIIFLVLTSCSREEDVEKYAKLEKWESYKATGYCWFGCSKDDFYQTSFEAITKEGDRIEGCTCSGFLFKNTTLRLK